MITLTVFWMKNAWKIQTFLLSQNSREFPWELGKSQISGNSWEFPKGHREFPMALLIILQNTNTVPGLTCNLTMHRPSSCWQPQNKIFFSQKFCTGCTFGINISDKKRSGRPQTVSGGMLNPTHSLTRQSLTAGHHAVMRLVIAWMNISWLVGIGKPGMPLDPLPCMMTFTRKKCCPQVRKKKKTSPTLNS